MCRLFGLMSKNTTDVRSWMLDAKRPFVDWSDVHCHGWGIAWYENGALRLEREPIPAGKSEKFLETSKNSRSRAFVCHLRKATCGALTESNSQPFRSGNWVFGHNGTVDREHLLPQLTEVRQAREGETDSEVYFLWLLQNLKAGGVEGLRRGIDEVRMREFTALNFVLSDGHTIYAYWEQSPSAKPPYESYYQLYYSKSGDPTETIVVCSERLDDRRWLEIPHRSLMIVSEQLATQFISFV